MKRRHLVVLVSAFTLLTIVFVAIVTVGVGVGTDAGREQIRSIIQQQVGRGVHGKVHIGRIGGSFVGGFTIDTFAIRDREDSLLVSLGPVTVEYDLRDLMDRRLLLRNVRVEHPFIRLRQYAKGDWNFQRIFRDDGPSGPDVPGRSFGDFVVLDSVRVKDGEFVVTRDWTPDDSLTGAKRDSAIRVNLANPNREIRRNTDGLTHTYRWSRISGYMPRVRIADPDSNRFGQLFVIDSLNIDEFEPPFRFRNGRGSVRKQGDSIFIDVAHFDLPASTGSARGKIWWGSHLPVRMDISVQGDSVALNDIAWVYATLPREGGGRTKLRITNSPENLKHWRYALTEMDLRTTKSRLTGAMTFVIGGPVLAVRDVNLRAEPVNFDMFRTLAGVPFPIDWQGNLWGFVRGPGGPLTNFVVEDADLRWHDTHVPGAVSRFSGNGELDILKPEFASFHSFDLDVKTLDLRSIQYLFPGFPRLGGTIAGTVTLDSMWQDVRFSHANMVHQDGPGEPTRVTGSGRVTQAKDFLRYDVSVNAEPVSLTMISRSYPMHLKGLMSGPIQAKGTTNDLHLSMKLDGPAGGFTYSGKIDLYPLSIAASGTGRMEGLDLQQLLAVEQAPRVSLTGGYQLDVRGDTNDLGTLHGNALLQLDRSTVDGVRVYPSRLRARFADGRMYLDTVRIESAAANIEASGALGLTDRVTDSVSYRVGVDSLGGLRRYVTQLTSKWNKNAALSDSLAGTIDVRGAVRGSLKSLSVSGRLTGENMFIRREAGKTISGSFTLGNLLSEPSGTFALQFNQLNVGGIALDSAGGTVRFEAAKTGVFTVGALTKNGVTFAAHGDLLVGDSSSNVVVRDVALVTDSSRWSLRGASNVRTQTGAGGATGFTIDSLVLATGKGGRIAFEGFVPDTGKAKILFRADSVPLVDVGQVFQLSKPLSGLAHVTMQGAGASTAPVMNMQARLDSVGYGSMRVERINATADYQGRRARVGLDLARRGRTALLARGTLPVQLSYFGAELLEDSLQATIRTDSATFDIVEALIPGLRAATGRLVANVDVAGTWKHPDVAGALRVENGEVTLDSLGIRLRGVNVDLGLFGHRDSLAIRRFSAWTIAPSDSASLRGYIAYRDLDNPEFNLQLHANGFRALDRRSLARLDVSTEAGGVRLTGSLHGARLSGGLVVDRGIIYLPDPELVRKRIDVSQFVDTAGAGLQSSTTSKLLESILIDELRVTLGDEVRLQSSEADIKLAGALNVERSARSRAIANGTVGALSNKDSLTLVLDGQLRADGGRYTLVLGLPVQREFIVENGGTVTFYGTADLPPTINVSALHTVRLDGGADLPIRVKLTGDLANPTVTLESAAGISLSQSNLVSYLMFGQPEFALGAANRDYLKLAASTLMPSAQAFAGTQLRSLLGSAADIVQWRPGTTDPTADEATGTAVEDIFFGSRLNAEKQISENLFVSLGTGLCPFRNQTDASAPSQWLEFRNNLSGKVELRLSRDASLRAGKEPSGNTCGGRTASRVVPTPSQWGVSLFKTWRF